MSNSNKDEPVVLAHQSYLKKDYNTALKHLNELENLAGAANKRVQHNKAVVEFMAGDMKNVEKLKKSICNILGLNFSEVEIKDTSNHYALYNYAVLLYHSRYYYQTTVVLESLLGVSKSIKDKKLLQHIILLLMEATLCRRTYDKTIEISKNHGDVLKGSEHNSLYERLVVRAHLMLDSSTNVSLKPDSIENCFIVAQQQYLKGDHKDAVNTLTQYKTMKYDYDIKSQGEKIWAAMNNNLGVIYLSLKKPFLSTKYFQNAVKEHFRVLENIDSDRLITCKDRPLYVHNLGVALLAANNYEGAFECLVEAARHYPNNPLVWLRIADCCVKKCSGDDTNSFSINKLGSGPHTRILFCTDNKEKYSTSSESFAIPSLSLEFAALCIRNAITLLPNYDPPSDINAATIQAPPGPPISFKQSCEYRNSALVLQSYILLQLQDPLAALTSANELLGQTDTSNYHKTWGHVYAAEALINLDRVTDAIEHLNPPVIHELVAALPPQTRNVIGVSVWAKAAVCHILRGDLVTARKILLQINSPRVLPLQVYLEICSGNYENCHAILRKIKLNNEQNKQ